LRSVSAGVSVGIAPPLAQRAAPKFSEVAKLAHGRAMAPISGRLARSLAGIPLGWCVGPSAVRFSDLQDDWSTGLLVRRSAGALVLPVHR